MTQDQLAHLAQFAQHAVRCMIVKITAVDLAGGTCTVDALDGGGPMAGFPFYGNDPVVGDLCMAWIFDGVMTVMGNSPIKNPSATSSSVLTAASGWAITESYINYSKDTGVLYINASRTGANIAGSSGGNITNNVVATLKAGFAKPEMSVGLTPMGGDRQIGGWFGADGVITMSFLGPNLTFNTGYAFTASASFNY